MCIRDRFNNCGKMVSCGTCQMPQTCGGGGVANQCGCTDNGAACNGKNCGMVTNNCGQMVSCGGPCVKPQTCGGGGVPNVCGVGQCMPKTCQQLGKNCGSVSDGC